MENSGVNLDTHVGWNWNFSSVAAASWQFAGSAWAAHLPVENICCQWRQHTKYVVEQAWGLFLLGWLLYQQHKGKREVLTHKKLKWNSVTNNEMFPLHSAFHAAFYDFWWFLYAYPMPRQPSCQTISIRLTLPRPATCSWDVGAHLWWVQTPPSLSIHTQTKQFAQDHKLGIDLVADIS